MSSLSKPNLRVCQGQDCPCLADTLLNVSYRHVSYENMCIIIRHFQAQSIKVHPFYLMVPATVCASFAFMLPVATPPNAIVFATGRLSVLDMVSILPQNVILCLLSIL